MAVYLRAVFRHMAVYLRTVSDTVCLRAGCAQTHGCVSQGRLCSV